MISGLHSCQPANAPIIGAIKTFVVEQRTGKSGKTYNKIKSAFIEKGGKPYKIISATPTGHTDSYGNISFNLDIESESNPVFTPQARPEPPTSDTVSEDPVKEVRQHVMRTANLYVLCVKAVEKYCAEHFPEVARTSEMFQAATNTLFIEASGRRSSDGVTWWSYIDKMPDHPIKQQPKRSVTVDEEEPF